VAAEAAHMAPAKASHVAPAKASHVAPAKASATVAATAAAATTTSGLRTRYHQASSKHGACQDHQRASGHDILLSVCLFQPRWRLAGRELVRAAEITLDDMQIGDSFLVAIERCLRAREGDALHAKATGHEPKH
jgi:hypothetical protein